VSDLRPMDTPTLRCKRGGPLAGWLASLALRTRLGRSLQATDSSASRKLLGDVRPIPGPLRPPRSVTEHSALALLHGQAAVPFETLVQRVARELYASELRHGGSMLDVGLFGPTLFVSDVAREILAADGILWRIDSSTDRVDLAAPVAADVGEGPGP
jgi:hypothetical protein